MFIDIAKEKLRTLGIGDIFVLTKYEPVATRVNPVLKRLFVDLGGKIVRQNNCVLFVCVIGG